MAFDENVYYLRAQLSIHVSLVAFIRKTQCLELSIAKRKKKEELHFKKWLPIEHLFQNIS